MSHDSPSHLLTKKQGRSSLEPSRIQILAAVSQYPPPVLLPWRWTSTSLCITPLADEPHRLTNRTLCGDRLAEIALPLMSLFVATLTSLAAILDFFHLCAPYRDFC